MFVIPADLTFSLTAISLTAGEFGFGFTNNVLQTLGARLSVYFAWFSAGSSSLTVILMEFGFDVSSNSTI